MLRQEIYKQVNGLVAALVRLRHFSMKRRPALGGSAVFIGFNSPNCVVPRTDSVTTLWPLLPVALRKPADPAPRFRVIDTRQVN